MRQQNREEVEEQCGAAQPEAATAQSTEADWRGMHALLDEVESILREQIRLAEGRDDQTT